MLGIHLAAIIAAVLALGGLGAIIIMLTGRRDRLMMVFLVLAELPICWLGVAYLRPAIDAALSVLSLDPAALQFVRVWYAPLTEEPLKLLPLVVPLVHRRIDAGNAVATGLALGLGFGIGEVGLLASVHAQNPQYAGLGVEMFNPFIVERLQACLFHGAMTASVIWLWFRGARWGILAAVAIHLALNFPIYLVSQSALGLTPDTWARIAGIWHIAATVALTVWIAWMIRKPPRAIKRPAAESGG